MGRKIKETQAKEGWLSFVAGRGNKVKEGE